MKKFSVSILFLAMFLPIASAQLPDVGNPGWEVGWESEEDEVIMVLDDREQFETVLEFWIDNTRPLPSDYEIEVEITYPSKCADDDNSFSIDVESKVNVGANTNETFEIKISGNGYGDMMIAELCPTSEVFSLELSVNDLIVAGQTGDGSKTIEQDLRFSPVYSLSTEFVETDNWNLVDDIKSGTSEFVEVIIRNKGNSIDSLIDPDFNFRYCPQMDYSISEGSTGGNANPEESWYLKIELSASSSHPDKKCELIFSVVSAGGGFSHVEVLEFNVDAIDVKEQNEELEEEEASDTSGLDSKSSTLPAISSLMCIFTVLISSFFRRELEK